MAELFNVVFAGEIAGRADPAAVRANVGKLFNASEAVLDKLFSGQPVVIKKLADRATAMQLRARMKAAGAETRLVAVDEQGRPLPAAAPAPAPAAATAPAPRPAAPAATPAPAAASMAERVKQLAEQQAKEVAARPRPDAVPAPAEVARVDTWALYPAGHPLSPPRQQPAPPPPEISGISLAASGGDLVLPQELARPAPVQVDISALSMAAAGTEVLKEEERRRVTPVQVDISGLSMAAAGTELEELREEKVPLNPDISHISLADG